MLKARPEDLVALWRDISAGTPADRGPKVRLLAKEAQEAVAEPLDLYSDYDDLFEESFYVLSETGMIGSDALRFALEDMSSLAGSRSLLDVLARLLRDSTELGGVSDDSRIRWTDLAESWDEIRAQSVGLPQQSGPELLSVAQVAERFQVTPQAVYRWIDRDKIKYMRRPGGSYMIPGDQFDDLSALSLNQQSRRPSVTASADRRNRRKAAREEQGHPAERVSPENPLASYGESTPFD